MKIMKVDESHEENHLLILVFFYGNNKGIYILIFFDTNVLDK